MADGSVVFTTELDAAGIRTGLDGLNGTINRWGAAIVGSKAFAKITEGLIAVTKAGIEYNAQMEAYQTNFAVLLGDEAAALSHVAEMREMAAKTPFGMEDLASANQTLLAFGISAEESMTAMQRLGDISLGNKERFSSLALAFAQVSSAGKLTGQDLLQMVNAGFNPLNTIAEKTGTNLGDLKEVMAGGKGSKEFQKQMKAAQEEVETLGAKASESAKLLAQIGEEGMISAEMVGLAMQMETSPGGRFYNGMEKASQTMQGLWSTLKDDAMQLAGNVFEPLSDVLTDKVLPAAISAVGALNGLFEADGSLEIIVETQEAIAEVEALEGKIDDIKTKYIADSIKVKVEYEESLDLIAELEAIQTRLKETPQRLWSEQDKADLQSLTSQLVALNPELSQFVGKDGIINKEASAVRELVKEYKELAIVEGARAAAAESWDVYFRAEAGAERLRNLLAGLEEQMQSSVETGERWSQLADTAGDAWFALAENSHLIDTATLTANIDAAREAMQAYIDTMGGLDPTLFEGIDLSSFFDGFAMLDTAEIASSADSVKALGEAMGVVADAALTQETAQAEVVTQLAAEIEAGSAAVAAAEATAAEALATAESYDATIQSLASGMGVLDGAAATANAAIDGVKENAGELTAEPYEVELTADDQASGVVSNVDQAVSDLNGKTATVYINVKQRGTVSGNVDGSHADGLSYVPYDNYLAYLHKGEMVLPAEEAEALRRLSSADFASGLASRTFDADAAYANAVAKQTVVHQTINFNQPVQTPDEFAQMLKMYATYGLADA